MRLRGGAVAVLGAGPAGLTAAHELMRAGEPVEVFEAEAQVGGLAKTVEDHGYRFDIGGHRFFTASAPIRALWDNLLGQDLLDRQRRSRILYNHRFFDYPLRSWNALNGLGPVHAAAILASYARARLSQRYPEASFEDWVVNRFGRRLYEVFFKTYTEKVWGIPCSEIGAQWAAQRIRGLSLSTALWGMFRRQRAGGPKTLIESFLYPRLGPGMMWDAMRRRIEAGGGRVSTSARVRALRHDGRRVLEIAVSTLDGERTIAPSDVISSIPLRDLASALEPAPTAAVLEAAGRLRYRDFIVVALVLDAPEVFPDTWLYIHDPSVRLGRVQNFRAWSPEMVPDPSTTCLGLEYFCFEGDDLWRMTDADLLAFAQDELRTVGLAGGVAVLRGTVVRVRRAYPIYDEAFPACLESVKAYISRLENLQVVGRNGMHRYNNMDHAMLTGMLAARNLQGERHDLWAADVDDETTYSLEGELD